MYSTCIKRLLDIVFSLIAMPFVIIFIIILTPFIYIDNPGPIFYNGIRRGRNGKPFKMLKFRSMYVNAADIRNEDGSTYNGESDTRVTKFGRFLRKTSLDEIPQLINVLKGDMSFVGPRPTLATKPFDELSEERKKCYKVRPGITGLAQAYYRNSICQEDKFKYDIYYVQHMSLLLDIKILLQTIKSVIKRENINNNFSCNKNEKRRS